MEQRQQPVPIAPAPLHVRRPDPPVEQRRPKRVTAKAACSACREHKTKCTAERPRCAECVKLSMSCVYDTAESETPAQAVKRKYNTQQTQLSAYEDLFSMLVSSPEPVSLDILRRMRQGGDVHAVLHDVRDGDLLLRLAHPPERS
ncbi:hypothetical protein EJ04DRAFT_607613 [Polyplosphaeria fusca]|uniref:Zn(2)-C6 fungal-type domain-containing protein n=1 Tax=Polyplosphaeria fusca TaxID=682080 RepID=A0A9P4QX96_9PLEO|nr:hypothetical protein EJ04DRAFT_607613 [Polyplosphaeria fusca]